MKRTESGHYLDGQALTAAKLRAFGLRDSLRDHFAGASIGIASDSIRRDGFVMTFAVVAARAYEMADAMLKAREAKR